MALKRKKGFSIATKTGTNLLHTNVDTHAGFVNTRSYYNEVIHFYFMLVNTDPSGLEIPKMEVVGITTRF